MSSMMEVGLTLTLADLASAGLTRFGRNVKNAGDKVDTEFKRGRRSLQDFTAELDKASTRMIAFGAGAKVAGDFINNNAVLPIIRAFSTVEDAQTKLKNTLMRADGSVPAVFDALNREATRLGDKMPGTTRDFYALFDTIIAKGQEPITVLEGLGEAAANLAVVTGRGDGAGYAETGTALVNIGQAAGIAAGDMNRFADSAQRAHHMGVPLAELESFYAKSAGALKRFNLQGIETSNTLNVIFARLNKTMSGDIAGSGLSGALSAMTNPDAVKKANKELARMQAGFKLDFTDESGNFVGLEKAIVQLEKLKTGTAENQGIVMRALFGESNEQLNVVSALMEMGVSGMKEMEAAYAAQASISDRVNASLDTLNNKWGAVTGTFENLLARIGASVEGEMKTFVDLLGVAEAKAGLLMDHFESLPKWAGYALGLTGGLLALVGTLALAGGIAAKTVGLGSKALGWVFGRGKGPGVNGGFGAGGSGGGMLGGMGPLPVYVVNMPGAGMPGAQAPGKPGAPVPRPPTGKAPTPVRTPSNFGLLKNASMGEIGALGRGAMLTAGGYVAAAGAAGYGAGTLINKAFIEGTSTGDAIGEAVARVAAFFGVEEAKQAVAMNVAARRMEEAAAKIAMSEARVVVDVRGQATVPTVQSRNMDVDARAGLIMEGP